MLIGNVASFEVEEHATTVRIDGEVINNDVSKNARVFFDDASVNFGDDTLHSIGHCNTLIGDVQTWTWDLIAEEASVVDTTVTGNDVNVNVNVIGDDNNFSYGDDDLSSAGDDALLIGDVQTWSWNITAEGGGVDQRQTAQKQ